MEEGRSHILLGREMRYQEEPLEDEAEGCPTNSASLTIIEERHVDIVDSEDSRVGALKQAQNAQ